jgi:hypothetical protein
MSEKLPPGSILASDFKIKDVPPDASLFFDDYKKNIRDVQEHVNENRLNLRSVHCRPGPIAWYDANGRPFNSVADYRSLKSLDVTFSDDFKSFIKKDEKKNKIEVGNGLTPGMIRQIIEYEYEYKYKSDRIYFFDFDMVLNQLSGLDFSFLSIPDNEDSLLKQYAKYIFSDHIGPEHEYGRLTLLQTMFHKIGPERIYVITSNGFANIDSDYLHYFIAILQILLPNFIPSHLVCTNPKNQHPLYNKKSAAIIDILNERAETMRKSARPSAIDKPLSARPSAIVEPLSAKPSARSSANAHMRRPSANAHVRRHIRVKGGSKRRMRGRCTRRKRRITG